MNTKDDQRTDYEKFLSSYAEDLMEMSDEDILDGVPEADKKKEWLAIVDSAAKTVAKQRLKRAKTELNLIQTSSIATSPTMSPIEARKVIQHAANDVRFTLAARGLEEMSDQDAVLMAQHVLHLRSQESGEGDK
jgi:hypothetical protein